MRSNLLILLGAVVLCIVDVGRAEDAPRSCSMSKPFRLISGPTDWQRKAEPQDLPCILTATNTEEYVDVRLTATLVREFQNLAHLYVFQRGRRVQCWIPLAYAVVVNKETATRSIAVSLKLPVALAHDVIVIVACGDKRGEARTPVDDPSLLPVVYDNIYKLPVGVVPSKKSLGEGSQGQTKKVRVRIHESGVIQKAPIKTGKE